MENNRFTEKLRDWYNGAVDFSDSLYEREEKKRPAMVKPLKNGTEYAEEAEKLENRQLGASLRQYRVLGTVCCLIFIAVLLVTVSRLPAFFSADAPTYNEVAIHYLEQSREQTGATSAVAGMILDYRAFDTLGESFVLFTATCAVLILMEQQTVRREERVILEYADDPIAGITAMALIPVILLFGCYVILNGHTSPGGGFAGGAILGSGFILYAMVYGDERALRVMSGRVVRIVTICALSFYCLAKSYSFFTGNEFNGVESVIRPGVPGTLLSGGLILPLNIAVGMVVCCTMYSFYMLFKRGRIG